MKLSVLSIVAACAALAAAQTRTATETYVQRKIADTVPGIVSNAVPSIVTNEVVVGFTEWEFSDGKSYDPNIHPDVQIIDPNTGEAVDGYIYEINTAINNFVYYAYAEAVSTNVLELNFMFEAGSDVAWPNGLSATRSRITRNALGLAMAEDLEKLPDHETVTNVARDVSNSFWDDKNSVLWKIAFKDGEPMFLPITNENVSVTGGVE